mmetsp:Transcript_26690/g.49878  ORF Transcript_26690/g.49878 Transcript_26690/m.49878 type:complete len:133 (-) Transcript_26690:181-579(-)|eukprot:CAMPEP_0170167576 /NCGR_PEP_ID=MMETSP0040_2-20121228/951_1 /TAXON_ID=641309 /ORGANISM="Lotharella oceanica, Strain CCMP622" /LENGTH=132 /DNA_ID=CAMNT_0010405661 /DNA_START=56 /DNA_END=454 /DNA_ORIENTATION=+
MVSLLGGKFSDWRPTSEDEVKIGMEVKSDAEKKLDGFLNVKSTNFDIKLVQDNNGPLPKTKKMNFIVLIDKKIPPTIVMVRTFHTPSGTKFVDVEIVKNPEKIIKEMIDKKVMEAKLLLAGVAGAFEAKLKA